MRKLPKYRKNPIEANVCFQLLCPFGIGSCSFFRIPHMASSRTGKSSRRESKPYQNNLHRCSGLQGALEEISLKTPVVTSLQYLAKKGSSSYHLAPCTIQSLIPDCYLSARGMPDPQKNGLIAKN